MKKEEKYESFPFTCDECGNNVENDKGSPIDFLCYSCLEEANKIL
ncbi:hypothetical protein BH23BAC1_BH23BAC1_38620 [soil metagenome]